LLTSDTGDNLIPGKKANWRTLVANVDGIASKRAALAELVDYTDPDAIIMTETKLDDTVNSAEFLPPSYRAFRKDRKRGGGGVMICIKSQYNVEEVQFETNSEVVWIKVHLRNQRQLLLGSFYRQPNHRSDQVESMSKTLEHLSNQYRNSKNCTFILGGDFNVGDIKWDQACVKQGSREKIVSQMVLDVLDEHHLSQMQREPTRLDRILDLFCTNKPGLVRNLQTIPGLSYDHHIILADMNIRPVFNKKVKRKVYAYSKADWDAIKGEFSLFNESYVCGDGEVEVKWAELKQKLETLIDKFIPSKLTSARYHLPWLSAELKRMTRRKHRLYNKAKKSRKAKHWDDFVKFKKYVRNSIRKAHWDHINGLLMDSLADNNTKPFWNYIKSQKQEQVGVAPLFEGGVTHTSAEDRAAILSRQFSSVFTRDARGDCPQILGQPFPSMHHFEVTTEGVRKLLHSIKPHKAAGPDNISCRLLKNIADELAPSLTHLFNLSLNTGILPKDWLTANVVPVYKKGNIHRAENYRPVSLTCVVCKILEHIVCKQIMIHLDKYTILTDAQHGFRREHSCESQLLITLHDLLSFFDRKIQVDVAVLDFSKAFDTVPHDRLIHKLDHYGIRGNVKNWIKGFLTSRTQKVLVDGKCSDLADVVSGVPQGTVLGPLLFLLHINDLPLHVTSKIRLFADDCLLYRQVTTPEDSLLLQKDLDSLENWGKNWGMSFNAKKCNILRISRGSTPIGKMYSLGDEILAEVDNTKYLGITISNDLNWSPHISKITQKANNSLAFLRRNLKLCPKQLKETAFKALVRSLIEYSASVWDPFLIGHINDIEKVQRRGARFVYGDYDYSSGRSVTGMIAELGWCSLADRRRDQRLAMLYRVINGLIAVPSSDILLTADARTRSVHRKNLTFRHIRANTNQFKNSFFPRTIVDWNKLDDRVVGSPTLEAFKSKLKIPDQPQHQ